MVLMSGHTLQMQIGIFRDGTKYWYFLKLQGDPSVQPRLSILVYFLSYKVYFIDSH